MRVGMLRCNCGTAYAPGSVHHCPPLPHSEHLVQRDGGQIVRPTMSEVMLRFAELLAERGTCRRLQVGAVVTDESMLQVLGIGYNGNAKGFRNDCDSETPGGCGCLHAELNALLKAPGTVENKRMFITHAPCLACAKAIINSRVISVTYRTGYRDPAGVVALQTAGVEVRQLLASGASVL